MRHKKTTSQNLAAIFGVECSCGGTAWLIPAMSTFGQPYQSGDFLLAHCPNCGKDKGIQLFVIDISQNNATHARLVNVARSSK